MSLDEVARIVIWNKYAEELPSLIHWCWAVIKRDLIAEVARRTGLPLDKAAQIVETILKAIAAAMGRGEEVGITGFGAFVVRRRAAAEGRNPRTGEEIRILPSKAPAFRPYRALKAALVASSMAGPPTSPAPGLPRRKTLPKPRATSVKVTVFYGTNRKPQPGSEPILDFGSTMANSLTYGKATVSVPIDREIGSLPRPSWWRPWEREAPANMSS